MKKDLGIWLVKQYHPSARKSFTEVINFHSESIGELKYFEIPVAA
jgi:hypothetical protein